MTRAYKDYLLILLEHHTSNFGPQTDPLVLLLVAPEIVLLFGLLVTIVTLGFYRTTSNWVSLLTRVMSVSYWSLLLSLLLLLGTFAEVLPGGKLNGIIVFQNSYTVTFYTQTIKIVIILSLLFIYNYLKLFLNVKYVTNSAELPLLLHISLVLAFIIISSSHFVILLLALEGFSLVLYILTTLDRSHGGVTAAVKYFTFGTLGSLFLLWGVVHYYALFPSLFYGLVGPSAEYALLYNLDTLSSSYNFAGTSVVVGFLIKLGSAPAHQWVPDVYAGSHLVVTTFFATVVKVVVFMLFCYVSIFVQATPVVFVFALSSLFVGTFATIRQVEVKRFLAYSSITHVGFLLMGDFSSGYLYLLTYVCSSLLFFSVLLSCSLAGREIIYLGDLRLVKRTGVLVPALLVVSLSSMAGLPPFSGFFGKYLVWGSLLEDIYLFNSVYSYFFLTSSVLLTLLTIFYYVRLVVYIYVSGDNEAIPAVFYAMCSWQQALLALVITFWLFLQPKLLTLIGLISYVIVLDKYTLNTACFCQKPYGHPVTGV